MIAPWQITEDFQSDPIATSAWGRADFDGCLPEFLIGLFSTAGLAKDESEWAKLYAHPPSPEFLRAALEPLAPAFEVFPEVHGPAFMQDFETLEGCIEVTSPELLIGGPTADRAEEGRDHFVKWASFSVISAETAAMALFVHQNWANSGGRGYMTSMRGGGPLSCRAVSGDTLWSDVWTSVLPTKDLMKGHDPHDPMSAFPWMYPTRTDMPVVPETSHPAIVFWHCPRRVRLVLSEQSGVCGLTGKVVLKTVRGFRRQNYGAKYPSNVWRHPFSAYRKDKDDVLPVRPFSPHMGLRDSVGLLFKSVAGAVPSLSVAKALDTRPSGRRFRLAAPIQVRCYGYVTDKARNLGYVDARYDTKLFLNPAVNVISEKIFNASKEISWGLVFAFSVGEWDEKTKPSEVAKNHISHEYHRHAEGVLTEIISLALHDFPTDDIPASRASAMCIEFLKRMDPLANRLLDEYSPIDLSVENEFERRAEARKVLNGVFDGTNKMGVKVFEALNLVLPAKRAKKPKKTEAKK